MSFWTDLKNRQLGQWTLAYLAGAWLVWQVMDMMGDRWGVYFPSAVHRTYDVTADDQRFVMIRFREELSELIVVENFFEELKRLVPN